MPKARLPENKGLPERWKIQHGAIYYRVPPGMEDKWDGKKWFKLGNTKPEAYKVWAARLVVVEKAQTIGQLLDRYALEVVPTKAPTTQTGNALQIEKIRSVFGDMNLGDLQPQHIYKYADKRGKKVSARREIALLSHVYTKAVEWGYISKHPFKGEVRLEGEKPRTRYIEDWEVIECLSLPCVRKRGSVRAIRAYIKLKLLTGLRRGDLLRLRVSDCRDEGIHITTSKTGKPIIYDWSDELRLAVDEAKNARPVDISPFIFCDKYGRGYVDEKTGNAEGWKSMWGRFMERVLAETKVTERFTEHDLRAKCASDADSLEHARALLAHADSNMTRKVYRRKPERVKPLR
jgi:integrase